MGDSVQLPHVSAGQFASYNLARCKARNRIGVEVDSKGDGWEVVEEDRNGRGCCIATSLKNLEMAGFASLRLPYPVRGQSVHCVINNNFPHDEQIHSNSWDSR